TMPAATQMYIQMQTQIDPGLLQRTHAAAATYDARNNEVLTKMRSQPTYVSETRIKQHHLKMRQPNGKQWRMGYDSADAALKARDRLVAQGYEFVDYIPKDDGSKGSGMRDDMLEVFRDLDQQHAARVTEALQGRPDLLATVLPMLQRTNEY